MTIDKTKAIEECAAQCRDLMADLGNIKRAYLKQEQPMEAVYRAADRYIAALKRYKQLKGDKKLRIPERARLVNWA